MGATKATWAWLFAIVVAAAGVALMRWPAKAPAPKASASRAATRTPATHTLATAHYHVVSSASPDQTRHVAQAVEQLHAAFTAFFPDTPASRADGRPLQMVVYRDQAQFKANNRSSPWAEAYYLPPACHAYYDQGQRNPVHWMLHESHAPAGARSGAVSQAALERRRTRLVLRRQPHRQWPSRARQRRPQRLPDLVAAPPGAEWRPGR